MVAKVSLGSVCWIKLPPFQLADQGISYEPLDKPSEPEHLTRHRAKFL